METPHLVTSFRIPADLYARWRGLGLAKGWSLRQRLSMWIEHDLAANGIDIPPQPPKSAWWERRPIIDGKALKKARQTAGLSQSQLARDLNMYPSTISRYESSHTRYIEENLLASLAEALGVEISSLKQSSSPSS